MKFPVKWTADFIQEDGTTKFPDIGKDVLDADPRVEQSFFERHQPEIAPEQIGDARALIVLTPKVTAASLAGAGDLLAVIRFGVGYDSVDVDACTEADVLLGITSGAVDRPVAEACVMWMMALQHHLVAKDRLVREGRWDDRAGYMGGELRDRALGVVGCGGIARELIRLLGGFGMKQPLAFDPFLSEARAEELGVRKVELPELMAGADFVSVHCPLTPETRGLIGRDELARMKPGAYILNTARGGIIEEDALFEALQSKAIAGAALDCFEEEPVTEPHRFGALDNVLLAPHSIAWTNELFRDIGRTAGQRVIDLLDGRAPAGVVNRAVLERPGFQEKWKRLTSGIA
ncbi:MAG: NAD(P)-dependent oxidoreductase [Puniceicoccaceae bacterium]